MLEGKTSYKEEIQVKKQSAIVLAVVLLAGFTLPNQSIHAVYYDTNPYASPYTAYQPSYNWYNYYGWNRGFNPSFGSTTTPTHDLPSHTQSPANADIEALIDQGKKYMGTPYEFGSDRSNARTFDCSDFIKHIFNEALNVTLPSDSRKQGAFVRENSNVTTSWSQLQRGDLMFFMSYEGSSPSDYATKSVFNERITHVGIYLGDGQILHTYSKKSGGVRIDNIENTAWDYRFLFGGSALN
jgi:cell wall-associated NlpC family hydrolase